MSSPTRVRLDSLTSLRFAAAALVVLSHSVKDLAGGVPLLNFIGGPGGVGVGFFFALSGFVLTWSHRAGDTPGRFYRRRFARVYPMHIITFMASVLILSLAGSNMSSPGISTGAAIAGPFLLQAWFPDEAIHFGMNAPSWSLSNEAFFYLLFPIFVPVLLRLTGRTVRVLLFALPAVVLVGALTVTLVLPSEAYYLLYVNPVWRLLGFIAGMMVARAVADGMRPRVGLRAALALTAAGYILLIAILLYSWRFGLEILATSGMSDALMLPLFLVLIAAAARSDLEQRDRWLARPAFVKLGEWSFALYLTHWLLIDVVVGIAPGVRDLSPKWGTVANMLFLLVAVAVSAACYQLIEAPLERRLRGVRATASPKSGATRAPAAETDPTPLAADVTASCVKESQPV